jgi:threonine/homoserine/homoserine lactone efflux protein
MPHILLFAAAALLLAVTPGPGMFYVVGRTWAAGRRDGLASSFGTMLGGLVHVTACVVGVSALVMASATAFGVLKLAGGIYLIYLGIQTFRAASRETMAMPDESQTRDGAVRAFRQGVVVEATNPKTAAFFLAFIPQFIVVGEGHVALQFLVLGVISVLLNTGADLVAVMGAAKLHERLVHRPSLFRRLRQGSGVMMASLGVGLLAARRAS